MKRIETLFILVIVAACLSSCASKRVEEVKPPAELDDEVASEEAAPQEGPVFTYDDAKIVDQAQEMCLTFSDEPVQLPGVGFVKLKGVVLGKEPVALMDVGGRAVLVRCGDKLGDYVITDIKNGRVKLEKAGASGQPVGTGFIPVRHADTIRNNDAGTGYTSVRSEQNE